MVNSAPFFLLSELVSVLTCLSIVSPLHLLSRGSPQLDFSSLASFAGGRKWDSTDSARLHRSTSSERIWLPVSFPLRFLKSHRQRMLLHMQATRRKKKQPKTTTTKKTRTECNSAIYKGHIATSLHIFQVVWVLEIAAEWLSNGDILPVHGLCLSGSPPRVTIPSIPRSCSIARHLISLIMPSMCSLWPWGGNRWSTQTSLLYWRYGPCYVKAKLTQLWSSHFIDTGLLIRVSKGPFKRFLPFLSSPIILS